MPHGYGCTTHGIVQSPLDGVLNSNLINVEHIQTFFYESNITKKDNFFYFKPNIREITLRKAALHFLLMEIVNHQHLKILKYKYH